MIILLTIHPDANELKGNCVMVKIVSSMVRIRIDIRDCIQNLGFIIFTGVPNYTADVQYMDKTMAGSNIF